MAGVVVSVLGGAFAPALVAAVNSKRANRLARDSRWLVGAVFVAVGAVYGLAWLALRAPELGLSRRQLMLIGPLFSVLGWLALHRLQRTPHARSTPTLAGGSLWAQSVLVVLVAQILKFMVSAGVSLLSR